MLTITPEMAEAFLLERQYLTTPAADPLDVVRRLGAIQAQYTVNVPVAFFSRSADANNAWVDDALATSRTLVKTWCMRGTLHAVASEDLALFASAIGQQFSRGMAEHWLKHRGHTPESLAHLSQQILEALGDGSLTRSEIHDRIPELASLPWAGWGQDMKILVYRGDAVFATPKNGTTSCFARRAAWLPHVPFAISDPDDALRELLRRYLAAHAPARQIDFAYWTMAGSARIRAAFKALKPDLIEFKIGGRDDTFYALAADEALLLDAPPPRPVNVLPKFDALMLAHKDKARHLPASDHKRVYRPAGQIEAVILLNGHVAATWRMKQTARALQISVEAHRKLKAAEKRGIQKEFERLAAFYGAPGLTLSDAP
jgi:hypothetical protein